MNNKKLFGSNKAYYLFPSTVTNLITNMYAIYGTEDTRPNQ
jgi:hypothetical protein